MLDERTPCQRAGLIAYWLGQGEGLTRSRINKLSGTTKKATRLLMRDLCDVLNLRMDENGVWSCHYGTPSQPQAARQRAIFVGYELATKGETRSSVLAKQLNINRKTAYKMLCNLSLVLPIYYDEHSRTWKVLDMRELD